MKKLTQLAAGIALVSGAAVSQAVEITGNVTLATDYVFRGVSQTNEKGAIQGGFDADFGNGFYLGTWASNVDFGSEVTTEMDFYGGYGFELSENVALDFSYIYFMYPGDEAALNYQEFVVGLSAYDFEFSVVYSDEYFGDGGPDAFVLSAGYSFSLSEATSLDLHVGLTEADDEVVEGEDNYIDYSIGVTHSVADLDLGLTWYGTDIDDFDNADDRIVFSISKSL
ncbi:hypothetical protein FKG94_20750 [Exilibacterium tricleocarpae]|uniref:Porin n=1 Tax=Exilibacterium tricleocarpae TaxID=2591008 RepID=A0A545T0K8_9GAMM|nr:TorF family putative porin [Exilibacterium tricleocarpae]TQV70758.1 hypothetical protein FKG94_20750 [Exilibacterium tricleocarpae]